MISRPRHLNAYEFAVVAALRAQQLMAGCTPRLSGEHKRHHDGPNGSR